MNVEILNFFENGIGREFHYELFCIGISESFPISIHSKIGRKQLIKTIKNGEWLTMNFKFKTLSNNIDFVILNKWSLDI
ncbi:hypothetical protein PRUPE_1G173200 [Prunus persica]|uniref:Uncharacterized protein n=1 Tax=Prunus persica TaxID=3760 RepID=M5XGL8_PRUPE|nr:hypothetical protein PRUPE_1G173200 [Prunus persica]